MLVLLERHAAERAKNFVAVFDGATKYTYYQIHGEWVVYKDGDLIKNKTEAAKVLQWVGLKLAPLTDKLESVGDE